MEGKIKISTPLEKCISIFSFEIESTRCSTSPCNTHLLLDYPAFTSWSMTWSFVLRSNHLPSFDLGFLVAFWWLLPPTQYDADSSSHIVARLWLWFSPGSAWMLPHYLGRSKPAADSCGWLPMHEWELHWSSLCKPLQGTNVFFHLFIYLFIEVCGKHIWWFLLSDRDFLSRVWNCHAQYWIINIAFINHSCADVAQNFHPSTCVWPLLMQTIVSGEQTLFRSARRFDRSVSYVNVIISE